MLLWGQWSEYLMQRKFNECSLEIYNACLVLWPWRGDIWVLISRKTNISVNILIWQDFFHKFGATVTKMKYHCQLHLRICEVAAMLFFCSASMTTAVHIWEAIHIIHVEVLYLHPSGCLLKRPSITHATNCPPVINRLFIVISCPLIEVGVDSAMYSGTVMDAPPLRKSNTWLK